MIQGIWNRIYKYRLKHLNLYSLKRRRIKGNLIKMLQCVKCFDRDKNKVLIVKEQVTTRTNGFKLDISNSGKR